MRDERTFNTAYPPTPASKLCDADLSETDLSLHALRIAAQLEELEHALVQTPHPPLVLGLRVSKALASLAFAANGHFSS